MPRKGGLQERRIELGKIFKMALRMEQRAQRVYEEALSRCDDLELRGILGSLRDDERRHERELKVLYRELSRFIELEAAATRTVMRAATAKGARKKVN